MTAITADIFQISGPARHVPNAVPAHHADRRVRDLPQPVLEFQECMTAVARKLAVPVAIGDYVNVMTEEAAQIANFLVEHRVGAVGIAASFK